MKYYKHIFLLFIAFLISYLTVLDIFYVKLTQNAIHEAESQVRNYLYSYSSVRQLIQTHHKPEVYRLIDKGFLPPEYFSPQLLSSTYSAASYINLLNNKLIGTGKPGVLFKLASDNPRNPANQADEYELNLLESMRRGDIQEVKELLQTDDGEIYFFAMPSQPIDKKCLHCHGLPENAPKEMIEIYGPTKGFYEHIGKIRALISIRTPMRPYYKKSKESFLLISLILFVIFVILYAVIAFFIYKTEQQNRTITKQNRNLEKLSITDPLTGLLNRHGVNNLANHMINIAARHNEELSLILLDIDLFKNINDRYGHAVGDFMLRETARILQRHQRTSDLVCRWGGEEFLIALPKSSLTNSLLTAERIRLELASHTFTIDNKQLNITASFGVTSIQPDETLEDLINRADNALYTAKWNGRNRVESNGVIST
jgi:diguanylate cyclase (GGDEF)-like protein